MEEGNKQAEHQRTLSQSFADKFKECTAVVVHAPTGQQAYASLPSNDVPKFAKQAVDGFREAFKKRRDLSMEDGDFIVVAFYPNRAVQSVRFPKALEEYNRHIEHYEHE